MFREFLKNKKIWLSFGAVLLLFIGAFFFVRTNRLLDIEGISNEKEIVYPEHPLLGIRCANYGKRPIAVLLAEDKAARPLSGISKADLIVEMPVVKRSINRFMALFICEEPEDIGSVRSSRHDFIPLAAGFDAIFAHWGGSYLALNELKKGILDNIDAMTNPFGTYYRKAGIYAPHDGFTSYERLKNSTEKLGYRTENKFEGYKHKDEAPSENAPNTIYVGYPAPYNVNYVYNHETNTYFRWRGGKPEKDKLYDKQVESKVLIVMFTNSRQLDRDYNDVDVSGEGDALIFQNGELERVKWQKAESPLNSKLKFLNEVGEETAFVAGKVWLHIADYGTKVQWGEITL